jgi:hypothetical protein
MAETSACHWIEFVTLWGRYGKVGRGKKSLFIFLFFSCAAVPPKSQARAFKHEFKRCQPLCLARQLFHLTKSCRACLYELGAVRASTAWRWLEHVIHIDTTSLRCSATDFPRRGRFQAASHRAPQCAKCWRLVAIPLRQQSRWKPWLAIGWSR